VTSPPLPSAPPAEVTSPPDLSRAIPLPTTSPSRCRLPAQPRWEGPSSVAPAPRRADSATTVFALGLLPSTSTASPRIAPSPAAPVASPGKPSSTSSDASAPIGPARTSARTPRTVSAGLAPQRPSPDAGRNPLWPRLFTGSGTTSPSEMDLSPPPSSGSHPSPPRKKRISPNRRQVDPIFVAAPKMDLQTTIGWISSSSPPKQPTGEDAAKALQSYCRGSAKILQE